MIPKKPAPGLIGGWEPVFGKDHATKKLERDLPQGRPYFAGITGKST